MAGCSSAGQGRRPEAFVGECETGHRARQADGQRPVDVQVAGDARPAEQVGVDRRGWVQRECAGVEGPWRGGPEIDRREVRRIALVADQVAAAAQAAHPGLDHGEREGRGDGGIDGSTAVAKDGGADVRGAGVLGRDRPAGRARHGLVDLPLFDGLKGHAGGTLGRVLPPKRCKISGATKTVPDKA